MTEDIHTSDEMGFTLPARLMPDAKPVAEDPLAEVIAEAWTKALTFSEIAGAIRAHIAANYVSKADVAHALGEALRLPVSRLPQAISTLRAALLGMHKQADTWQ